MHPNTTLAALARLLDKRRKHKKSHKLRPMTEDEEEMALLEPLEFMSKKPTFSCCGETMVLKNPPLALSYALPLHSRIPPHTH